LPRDDVREIRRGMSLSQSQFAAKFNFPLATPQNWERVRARPNAPTGLLLADIARHPEAAEDVLDKAN
jgi:putative transcriptional regulator